MTVLGYRNGRFDSIVERNGNFGLAQLQQTVPAGEDVITVYGDGRQNDPVTPGARLPRASTSCPPTAVRSETAISTSSATSTRPGPGPAGTC